MDWLIFWLAIGAHVPLVLGIKRQLNDTSQTFITWILYFLLDVTTMFSTTVLNGNFVILFGFSVGSFVMSIILLYQKRFSWTWLETIITMLVFVCLISWYYSGPYMATVLGIISESIVGIHLIIKTWIKPVVKYNLTGYVMFLLVSILTMLNAKDTSIPEIGYGFCETILSLIILIPLIRKRKIVVKRYYRLKMA